MRISSHWKDLAEIGEREYGTVTHSLLVDVHRAAATIDLLHVNVDELDEGAGRARRRAVDGVVAREVPVGALHGEEAGVFWQERSLSRRQREVLRASTDYDHVVLWVARVVLDHDAPTRDTLVRAADCYNRSEDAGSYCDRCNTHSVDSTGLGGGNTMQDLETLVVPHATRR